MATHTIFITSPLEPELVERIRAVDPARIEVIYQPDLLPPTRYIADHKGAPFTRTEEQTGRWREAIARADIMWDFPQQGADGTSDVNLAKRLKWVQTTSAGVGPLVRSLGPQVADVLVTTARGVHAGPLAEFVFMALLAHFRGLRHLETEQRAHRWIRYCGTEVAGRTIVTIGAGDLARGVAKVGRGLDMHTVAVARTPEKQRQHNDLFQAIQPTSRLHDVLGSADAVVVTVPHTPATERLIDAAAFAAMKPGCAFVNIGRGQVVDEAAMLAALRSGHLGFAALDVAVE
jgi:phosphoglycerate dehydrogenase-like enzyme